MKSAAQKRRQAGEARLASQQRGFTLVELAIATVVFLVGVVAVMQLVPAALQSNLNNRVDTTSVVVVQRELDQMVKQPFSSVSFTDADGNVCNLGSAATPNVVVGSPVTQYGNFVRIDFTQPLVAGYNFQAADPLDRTEGGYDVRWAVITSVDAKGKAVSKRFIVGARQNLGARTLAPVSLDSWQQLSQ
jgi:prepilin-type N-terminal cleavage/methylation domain-containing protein